MLQLSEDTHDLLITHDFPTAAEAGDFASDPALAAGMAHAGGPLTPCQIGERTLVPSATVTSTLALLEYRGWVARRANPEDRRSILVEITAAGRAVADRMQPGIRTVEANLLGVLTPRERTQLLRLLGKLLDRAPDWASQATS